MKGSRGINQHHIDYKLATGKEATVGQFVYHDRGDGVQERKYTDTRCQTEEYTDWLEEQLEDAQAKLEAIRSLYKEFEATPHYVNQ